VVYYTANNPDFTGASEDAVSTRVSAKPTTNLSFNINPINLIYIRANTAPYIKVSGKMFYTGPCGNAWGYMTTYKGTKYDLLQIFKAGNDLQPL